MTESQGALGTFHEMDYPQRCVAFFNTQRQARLTEDTLNKNFYRLKKIANQLNLENERELFAQIHKGNTKSISALESLLLRPHPKFFDGPGMYKVFEEILLPQLINQNSSRQKISIWVPGCTEGCEAYSVALLLHAHAKELEGWDISVHATDTDNNALKQAEKASFDVEDIDEVIFDLYGQGLKKNGDEYLVRSAVRDLISFQYNNFYDSTPPSELYDVILFRDHLKHWQPELQEKIIKNIEKSIQPHGHLVLSYGESLLGLSGSFKPALKTQGFYQKIT